jgi:hypothetical protein
VPGCKAGVVTEFPVPHRQHSLRGRGGPDRGSHTGTRYHKSRRKGVADDQGICGTDDRKIEMPAFYPRHEAALAQPMQSEQVWVELSLTTAERHLPTTG